VLPAQKTSSSKDTIPQSTQGQTPSTRTTPTPGNATALSYNQQTPGLQPTLPNNTQPASSPSTTFYTYRAQLTFQMGKTKAINVAGIFSEWH
jgi:hypothetical protein